MEGTAASFSGSRGLVAHSAEEPDCGFVDSGVQHLHHAAFEKGDLTTDGREFFWADGGPRCGAFDLWDFGFSGFWAEGLGDQARRLGDREEGGEFELPLSSGRVCKAVYK